MNISPQFARVLAAGRGQFNQRVLEARHRFPALDQEAFAEFLTKGVDPLILAVAQSAPDRVASVVVAAFDAALELAGQGIVGARGAFVRQVWSDVLPGLAVRVADAPQAVLGALTNAAVAVERCPGARPFDWLRDMRVLGPRAVDHGQLLGLGQVLAWRAGLAHFRSGALAAADRLPEPLALAAIGAGVHSQWAEVRTALTADPWWRPVTAADEPGPRLGQRLGEFVGFGGPFPSPPDVRPCGDGFVVESGGRYSYLIADACGASLHPATKEEYVHADAADRTAAPVLRPGAVESGGQRIALDLPAEGVALTWNAHTLAVSSSYSYAIRLFPRWRQAR